MYMYAFSYYFLYITFQATNLSITKCSTDTHTLSIRIIFPINY